MPNGRVPEREVELSTPGELRPVRRVRSRYAPHPMGECDCPYCWTVRPMTDGEVRQAIKKRESRRNLPPEYWQKIKEKYPPKSRWEQRHIVAWDGEGANYPNGSHYYNLLANSKGDRLIGGNQGLDGLATKDVFDFMLYNSSKNDINVIFGGSYDVNMILRDLPEPYLRELWTNNRVKWDGYRITWTPRKRFGVAPLKWNGRRFMADDKHAFVLWDVFGYFQCAFVTACQKWDILTELEADAMQVMKWGRSTFTVEQLPEIIHYNDTENQALVKLVGRLFDAMDEAGIVLERYDGAGSIATALLKKHQVYDHAGDPEDYLGSPTPSPVYLASKAAYSGGRIEPPKVGNYIGPVYRSDLNSAYPAACLDIPSFTGAEWRHEPEWNGDPNSIVCVEWHIKEEQPFYPLWYRGWIGQWKGQILYPRHGLGEYYGIEFLNIQQHFVSGRDYVVRYALNVYLADDTKPFAWLEDIYQIRLKLKQEGNLAQMVIRLGMNSIYGKCAQQEGYSSGTSNTTARYPGTHHLIWAGLMTARTRHTLYQAAMQKPDAIIAFATDAVFSSEPLDLPEGTGLGEWTTERFAGMTIVQAGVYWLLNEDTNEWESKYRGFDPGSLQRDDILRLWEAHTYQYPARLTRFCGLGSALGRNEGLTKYWRQWVTDNRDLTLHPTGKRTVARKGRKAARFEPHVALTPTQAAVNMEDGPSMPYPVVWIDGQKGIRPDIDDVDIRILEQEWEDSYE